MSESTPIDAGDERRTVDAYFAAMRQGAAAEDELLALFTDDAVYSEPFSGSIDAAVGIAEIRARFRAGWAEPLPDMELVVHGVEITGDAATSSWECRSPALPGPVRGTDHYSFRLGRIAELRVTIDTVAASDPQEPAVPLPSITLADLEADPDPILAAMRAHEPVAFVDALDMWLVTRWDDVAEMEARPDRFSAATNPSFLARALGENMLTTDPPEHTRLQGLFRPVFQPGGRSGVFASSELVALADRIIDGLDPTGFDVMAEFAQPLAAASLATVLGLDHHGFDRMWSWCEGLCADIANFENDPALTGLGLAAKAELGAAIADRVESARHDGDESGIGVFVRAGATPEEIVNNVRLMISGGINEPRDGIGLVTWVLLDRPDLRARVAREPAKLKRLVEEVFRVFSPVGTITRQATQDVELGGVTIPAGALVAGVLRSVNLDESHWSRPSEIDLDRREGAHGAFALGAHRCLGEWLGRQVVRVGVERLFTRFESLALAPDAEVVLHGFEFRGPQKVSVVAP